MLTSFVRPLTLCSPLLLCCSISALLSLCHPPQCPERLRLYVHPRLRRRRFDSPAVSNFTPRQLDVLCADPAIKVKPVVNQLALCVGYNDPGLIDANARRKVHVQVSACCLRHPTPRPHLSLPHSLTLPCPTPSPHAPPHASPNRPGRRWATAASHASHATRPRHVRCVRTSASGMASRPTRWRCGGSLRAAPPSRVRV